MHPWFIKRIELLAAWLAGIACRAWERRLPNYVMDFSWPNHGTDWFIDSTERRACCETDPRGQVTAYRLHPHHPDQPVVPEPEP